MLPCVESGAFLAGFQEEQAPFESEQIRDRDCFFQRLQDTYDYSMAYLRAATRDQLECANGIHYLVRDYSDVAWSNADFTTYMKAVDAYWKAT